MTERSYVKSVVIAAGVAAVSAIAAVGLSSLLAGPAAVIAVALATIALVLAGSVALAGLVVIARWRRMRRGGGDWYLTLQERARDFAGAPRGRALRRLVSRWLNGHDFLVGDRVRIRSLDEIRATLAADGTLDALPFQEEMRAYCGRIAVVFASIDKIYDYNRTREMRRLESCVVLDRLFCDGAAHGGCQARCRQIWKTAWLVHAPAVEGAADDGASISPMDTAPPASNAAYVCQFTQLASASKAMSRWGLLKELRPLVAGNVPVSAFALALATRWFNLVQRWRGGVDFPPTWTGASPASAASGPATPEPELREGDWVVVRPYEEIAVTLDARGKHRGLWFDADMRKFCGRAARVAAKVERIIDNTTGRMLTMKTPCYVLEDVYYTGESQSFAAQHEWLFWRQAWLRSAGRERPPT